MKNKIIATIGYVDHGKTTLSAAIKDVLKKEMSKAETILEQGEKVYQFQNPYTNILDISKPSKSRLKKCEKGLHEFIKTNFVENNIPKWSCRHCGIFMNNR